MLSVQINLRCCKNEAKKRTKAVLVAQEGWITIYVNVVLIINVPWLIAGDLAYVNSKVQSQFVKCSCKFNFACLWIKSKIVIIKISNWQAVLVIKFDSQ